VILQDAVPVLRTSVINPSVSSDSPLPSRLFIAIVEEFLGGIHVIGYQNGFGVIKDQILFQGEHGSTLAVPLDTLLEPRDIALEIIRSKVASSHRQFVGAK
jgi:hypothetical protein